MGKKSKKALEQAVDSGSDGISDDDFAAASEEPTASEDPADDDVLIPYHTKQASLAMIYLLFFSCLMFTLPFAAFFGMRHFLIEYMHIEGFATTCWSVLSAVVTVNIIIALYAIFGFRDAKKEEDIVKQRASTKEKTN